MVASSPGRGRLLASLSLGALGGLLVGACGQVTGLSDDYRYDLEAGTVLASEGGSDGSSDASATDGGPKDASNDADAHAAICGPADQKNAQTDMSDVGDEGVPLLCRTCLATFCCKEIEACNADSDCQASMKCIFACQRDNGQNRVNCLQGCHQAFVPKVGPCIQSSCSTNGTCSLE